MGFLSRTYPGKAHDKGIAGHESIAYPSGTVLHKDLGFRGYEPDVAETRQPGKKPPGRELTAAQKRENRRLARSRVRVEHAIAGVKRSRAVKDELRNTREGFSDAAMEAASALHDLRVNNRKRRLRR